MKERPIIFSSEMVLAILDGKKTQTRRVIKNASGAFWDHAGYYPKALNENPEIFSFFMKSNNNLASYAPMFRCPHGQPGDQLWCKETWMPETEQGCPTGGRIYKASDKPEPDGDMPLRWRSPIFMPRWASRITLEITGVRVERVQDISEEDAYAEGRSLNDECDPVSRPGARWFQNLWDSLNAKRGFGWEVNPFVWVIEFKRIEEGKG